MVNKTITELCKDIVIVQCLNKETKIVIKPIKNYKIHIIPRNHTFILWINDIYGNQIDPNTEIEIKINNLNDTNKSEIIDNIKYYNCSLYNKENKKYKTSLEWFTFKKGIKISDCEELIILIKHENVDINSLKFAIESNYNKTW